MQFVEFSYISPKTNRYGTDTDTARTDQYQGFPAHNSRMRLKEYYHDRI